MSAVKFRLFVRAAELFFFFFYSLTFHQQITFGSRRTLFTGLPAFKLSRFGLNLLNLSDQYNKYRNPRINKMLLMTASLFTSLEYKKTKLK